MSDRKSNVKPLGTLWAWAGKAVVLTHAQFSGMRIVALKLIAQFEGARFDHVENDVACFVFGKKEPDRKIEIPVSDLPPLRTRLEEAARFFAYINRNQIGQVGVPFNLKPQRQSTLFIEISDKKPWYRRGKKNNQGAGRYYISRQRRIRVPIVISYLECLIDLVDKASRPPTGQAKACSASAMSLERR